MQIKANQAIQKENSSTCKVREYEFNKDKIGFAITHIKGVYPEQGYSINNKCDGIYYVISGIGKVIIGDEEYTLNPKDAVCISKGTRYRFEGDELIMSISNTPAWNVSQYDIVQ